MIRSAEALMKQDMEFWGAVKEAALCLLPPTTYQETFSRVPEPYSTKNTIQTMYRPLQERIISAPQYIPDDVELFQVLNNIYSFFSFSPDHFVPVSRYVCNLSIPLAYDEKRLLQQLWCFCQER